MRFLTVLIDALVGFVQRNPLTVLVIVLLAVGAPALLRGIALFVLYFLLAAVLAGACAVLLFRWRIRRMQREMERQFGEGFGRSGGFGGGPSSGGFRTGRTRSGRPEGEVRVHVTQATPDKRVAEDVGDYVDFEETK